MKDDSKIVKHNIRGDIREVRHQSEVRRYISEKLGVKGRRTKMVLPMESLTASSWPFFLVQIYFPLLAFSATLWPSHSTENMVLADL